MALPHLLLALDTYCFSPSPLCLFHVPSQYYMSDVRSKYHNLFFTHGPDEQNTEASGEVATNDHFVEHDLNVTPQNMKSHKIFALSR